MLADVCRSAPDVERLRTSTQCGDARAMHARVCCVTLSVDVGGGVQPRPSLARCAVESSDGTSINVLSCLPCLRTHVTFVACPGA
eukprot:7781448-Alexandrium_andersonii.AAC.1